MINKNIFSIPFSQKHQMTMKRRFIIFSTIFFLLIFIFGSITFIILMGQNLNKNVKEELMKTVGLERYKMEATVNAKIAIVLNMANSPFIRRYFSSPDDPSLKQLALDEINSYSEILTERTTFWVNDQDKIFYTNSSAPYTVDPDVPENYWYNMTLYGTDIYNFNINYNPDLGIINLWLNAPVYNDDYKPVGIVGTGVNLSYFINNIYANYSGNGELYFFNKEMEITGARKFDLAKNKINIQKAIAKTGSEITAKINNLNDADLLVIDLKNTNGVAVLGAIPSLNWYITAVHEFSATEYLHTGLFALFLVMIIIIFSVFLIFNIFVIKLMKPLYQIINGISQITDDLDLYNSGDISNKTEVETIGELVNLTIIDQLTGIYNRRFFIGNMKKIIRYLSRSSGKLSVLMIDVDFFKKYNDTYGHDMGDKCLKKIATALSRILSREDDFLARYGGEEFVAVLPNTSEDGAAQVAQEMLKAIYDCKIPHKKNEDLGFVTVSIGGTTGIVEYSHNVSAYVKCADAALYKSKQNGRNRYTFETFDA